MPRRKEIRRRRKEVGATQETLAALAGLHPATGARAENTEMCTPLTRKRIAAALEAMSV